jgi:hypothetical protein
MFAAARMIEALKWPHGEESFLGQLRRLRHRRRFVSADLVGALRHSSYRFHQLVDRLP